MTAQRTLTRLMSVSYCKAEPDVAVTTPARRKMPCSSRSFLMLRTWESRVCRSRSWRYFSFEPQMNSNSFLTCLLTNGVCWIIRYWGEKKYRIKRLYFCVLCRQRLKWKIIQVIHSTAYFRQIVEPGMVKDRRWDTWVGVSNLLDLIRQPEHHFSQKLWVGFKHISSMSLREGATQYVQIPFLVQKSLFSVLKIKTPAVVWYLDILAQEERAHVWWRGSCVWSEELACRHRLLFTLLALPELQERFEHVETVVNSPEAEQSSRCGIRNKRRWLQERKRVHLACKYNVQAT